MDEIENPDDPNSMLMELIGKHSNEHERYWTQLIMQKRAVLKEQTEISNSVVINKMNNSDRLKEKQAIKNKVDELAST